MRAADKQTQFSFWDQPPDIISKAQKSPCAQRFLRSTSNNQTTSASETPNGHLSSSEDNNDSKSQKSDKSEKSDKTEQSDKTQSSEQSDKSLAGRKTVTDKKQNGETDVRKKRVTIAKNSITPPISSSSTPQRVRRSQSLSSTRASGFTEFEKACLKAHNEYRAKHAVPLLKLSKRLCRFSEILASRGTPVHRNNSPYGENIFCSWSSIPNMVVKGWEPVEPGNFIGSFTENVPPIGGFDDEQIENAKRSLVSYESFLEPDKEDDLNLEIFIKAILRYHNEYRRKHGAPELKLNKILCAVSQEWAETLATEDRFAHRPNSNYGENIYCLWSSDRNARANPREVCRSWYEEIKEHDFKVEPKGIFKAGHFTQLVWKSSQDLGVGVSKTKKGKVLVVCNYNPRGNIAGQFSTNVLKAR